MTSTNETTAQRLNREAEERRKKGREEEERRQDDWNNSLANPLSPISIAIDIATPGGLF